ncbi:hypothetical protein C0Q70_16270 [Pomacea canaliculata]|uniref:Lysosomal cobalamin transporter n=1 Tax=Pomacea canaliculata TaxID=400727 RepID=A0A2T7NPA9_POMCA|nr:hypothetical protein C0Q70_16270 [Pomacea canaliculata]
MALSFTLAAGWIPFVVVLVLTLLFSAIYIRYYMSKYDSELSTTLTAIFALTVTLLTSDLVPVDIFLVSFMKNQDGTFKDWAKDNSTRNSLEDSVLYAYYSVLSLCRAFVPTKSVPSSNSTEWIKIKGLFEGLASNGGEDALSFVICVFSLLGMLGLITYTAYGMSALPMELVAGRKSTKKERMAVQSNRSNVESHRETIRAKYGLSRSTSTRYQRRNAELEEQERQLARQERHLAASENSWCQKCLTLLRPFEIVLGVVCFLLALLVFISLLLTNIDKAMNSLGYKFGFALPHRHLPNPIDIVLVFCQKLFPLDYILMTGVTVYFVLCSMTGVCRIGIWFFWIRMYKVRPRRTMPQGLLMFCMILMFLVLAINVVIYELTPQYSSFGSQHYLVNTTGLGNSTVTSLEPCSTDASSENCTITRMALLLTRFFYKMWFFGAAYYVCTWAFLGTFLLGFVIVLCRGRRSAIQGEVDSDDFDESDDELLHA